MKKANQKSITEYASIVKKLWSENTDRRTFNEKNESFNQLMIIYKL